MLVKKIWWRCTHTHTNQKMTMLDNNDKNYKTVKCTPSRPTTIRINSHHHHQKEEEEQTKEARIWNIE